MKKLTLGFWVFSLILLTAVFLRFYIFPVVPPSLNWDEVSIGYNAWSILSTGRDEYGTLVPKFFRSLDDYKPPVYIYLTVPAIALLGPTDAAVRLPSLLSGLLFVVIVYFLSRELFGLSGDKKLSVIIFPDPFVRPEPYLASLFVAISPWTVQFSRMASEANVGALFIFAAILFFLISLRKRGWLLPLSILFLILASYAYQSYRVLAPLTGLLLFLLYRKKLPTGLMVRITTVLLIVAAGLSMAADLKNPDLQVRLQGTNVISRQLTSWGDTILHRNQREMEYDAKLGINKTRRLFHDSPFFWGGDLVLQGYLSHFSPLFLFFDSTRWHHTPFIGLLYLIMLPLIISGSYRVIRDLPGKTKILMFGLLLLTPVPAAVTYDVPHPIRTLPLAVIFAILAAFGTPFFLKVFGKPWRLLLGIGFAAILGFSVFRFFHQYFIHVPSDRAADWQYGRRELAEFLLANKNLYDRVVFLPELEWPYIFMLWYLKYPPAEYLKEGGTVSGGFAARENRFSVFEFREVNSADQEAEDRVFVAGPADKINNFGSMVFTVSRPDGSTALDLRQL